MNSYDPNYVPKKHFMLVGQKAIILNNMGQILILQRSQSPRHPGKWSLAGGALEDHENPYEGIEREIREETGLNVAQLQPFQLRSYANKDNDAVIIIGYTCKAATMGITLNWEHTAYKWVTKEEALTMDLTEDGRFFVEKYVTDIPSPAI